MILRVIIALTFLIVCTFVGSLIHIGAGNLMFIGFIIGFILGGVALGFRSSNREVSQREIDNNISQARKIIGPPQGRR
jgi:hypothetical protein